MSADKLPSEAVSGESERGERLQKVLAEAGLGSRRSCEEFITTGRVTVDGDTVSELGTRVDPWKQRVCVDGERIKLERRQYYLLNKPAGVLCTTADPAGRPRAIDLVPRTSERLFTVGRLDENTEGLVIITNDGDMAHRLAHPRFQVERRYRALVAGHPTAETFNELAQGMYFADGKFRVRDIRRVAVHGAATMIEITLTEGQNREIRRLLARVGHKVMKLMRVAFGPARLGSIPVGEYRALAPAEVKQMLSFSTSQTPGGSGRPLRKANRSSPNRKGVSSRRTPPRATGAGRGSGVATAVASEPATRRTSKTGVTSVANTKDERRPGSNRTTIRSTSKLTKVSEGTSGASPRPAAAARTDHRTTKIAKKAKVPLQTRRGSSRRNER